MEYYMKCCRTDQIRSFWIGSDFKLIRSQYESQGTFRFSRKPISNTVRITQINTNFSPFIPQNHMLVSLQWFHEPSINHIATTGNGEVLVLWKIIIHMGSSSKPNRNKDGSMAERIVYSQKNCESGSEIELGDLI